MRLLELFSGTGSIGRAFIEKGFEVVSVDIDPKANATHTCNILDWDCTVYPPDHFDVVWGSPPCTMYSRARTTGGPRDLEGSDRLVAKTLEVIHYFNPRCWAFENVGTGLLPGRAVVAGIPCSFLTYCKYADGDFPKYRKLTAVWHNLPWTPRPICCKASRCAHIIGDHHPVSAQRAPAKYGGVRRTTASDRMSLSTLYSMPPALCAELAEVCREACQNLTANGAEVALEPLHAGPSSHPEAIQLEVHRPLHEAHVGEDHNGDDQKRVAGH
jgi:hypothetical protein